MTAFVHALIGIAEGHATLLMLVAGLSMVTCVVSLVSVPWIIGRMPADYFITEHGFPGAPEPGVKQMMLSVFKNGFGLVLVAAGIIMLVIPGQGLLTTVLGLVIMDFPGKRHLERALLGRAEVRNTLNWIRKRQGLEPFEFH